MAISGVCDKHAGASFRLLPAVSVLYQYLGPSLMLHSIAAGLWEYSLDGSFGIFTIAASVFGHCLIFCRQIMTFYFKFCHQGSSVNSFLQADHSLFSVLPPGVRAALPKMWANDVLDHLVIVRVVGVSLSGQRSLVLRPKALNVGAEGPQCRGRRPSDVSARWLDSRVHHTPCIARG